jgi:uncharacterized protein YdaU (DUF1376 family)
MPSPSFMAIDEIEAFDRALDEVSIEAAGAAFKLMVKTFIRGKAFADDEAAARALHMQVRRLCRVKDQFDEFFGFASKLVTKARRRFECRTKSELNSNFSPKNPIKSASASQMKNSIDPKEGIYREAADGREDAPPAAPADPFRVSRKRQRIGKKRPKPRRTWPPKAPLPDGWMPGPAGIAYALSKGLTNDDVRRELDRFTNHSRAHGTRFADVDAGWRRWVDRVDDFRPRGRREPPSIAAAFLAGSMSVESRRASYG